MNAIDRATLDEAITFFDTEVDECEGLTDVLVAAAKAYRETLPKTKVVEVWRVEYASGSRPCIYTFMTRGAATNWVARVGLTDFSCVKLTGPHYQEVNAP